MAKPWFARLALIAAIFAFCVSVVGAFVRLTDAGLGCPDWPGCYGRLVVPQSEMAITLANEAFPERPVEIAKGWKEMVHRYLAGILGLMIFALSIGALKDRRETGQGVGLPVFLSGLVIFQAILGAWTVTWQLKPVVVMGHLLGGAATISLLWWLAMRENGWFRDTGERIHRRLRAVAVAVTAVVVVQIALGGWTSANYAALACTDFPTCHGQWWPRADFGEAFVLWRGLGVDYEFGILDNPARVAIQLTHRIGAVVTLLAVLGLVAYLLTKVRDRVLRNIGWVLGGLILIQFALGISNVLLSLPLSIAVAHNAFGLLLLVTMVTLLFTLRHRKLDPASA
ncbi:cytochrome B [Alkalilimnicola ehrlichii]|uniref:Cytochrome B n=1 Tax=Alkalilimnicola ehrlichii TaxID=351052 RepID=A0A3E0X3W4_9GAMM|nr:COX15/CtaA family protein [Alkalilimnicola ehrlichii]RFA31187.1 cytochrome B [Alkalilimnicola ehrlichii]RFA39530.1 cytochrome B [Alkalilimnicola ehrlichii]